MKINHYVFVKESKTADFNLLGKAHPKMKVVYYWTEPPACMGRQQIMLYVKLSLSVWVTGSETFAKQTYALMHNTSLHTAHKKEAEVKLAEIIIFLRFLDFLFDVFFPKFVYHVKL